MKHYPWNDSQWRQKWHSELPHTHTHTHTHTDYLQCFLHAAPCVQAPLASHQNNRPQIKMGSFGRLRGEDGPGERPREWQLAGANRTTANGTPHLLLRCPCPPPIPLPTSGLLEIVLSSSAVWHLSSHNIIYSNIHNAMNMQFLVRKKMKLENDHQWTEHSAKYCAEAKSFYLNDCIYFREWLCSCSDRMTTERFTFDP